MAKAKKRPFYRLYILFTIFIGYSLLLSMLSVQPVEIDYWREITVFIVLGILAEWFVISLPQGSLSVGFAVILATFLIFDTSVTVLVSVLSAIIGNAIFTKAEALRTTLFNGAQYAISIIGAAYAYYYVGGVVIDKISFSNTFPLLVFILSYFTLNQLLVNLFLWPSNRQYTRSTWITALKWDVFTYFFAIPVGILMFLIYNKTGLLGGVLLFIPVLTLKYLLRLYINLEIANKELSVLYDVAKSLGSSLDLTETLGLILTKTRKIISFHTSIIYLWDEEEQVLVPSAVRSPYSDKLKGISYPLGEGIVGSVAKTGEPQIVYDSKKSKDLRKLPGITQFLRSMLVVPLTVDEKIIGVVVVGKREPYAYEPKQMQILTILGGQAAVAMANALLYKKIEKLAIIDGLTKVYNYRYFYKKLNEEYERSKQYRSNFSLIMVDIDYFKRFNDDYGHKAGDAVLFGVAQIIKKDIRNIDIVARYGGEEFAILLPEVGREYAKEMAKKISKAINDTAFNVIDDSAPVGVAVSMGVSTYPIDSEDKQEIVELADQALYYSKEHGRNRVTLWSEIELVPARGKISTLVP